MKHLAPAYTEGQKAWAANLSCSVNPYHEGSTDHAAWEAGWVTARASGGMNIPVDIDVSYPEIDESFWQTLAEEIVADVEHSMNSPYMKWFTSLDPRAQEIVLALDTPVPSGDLSARARFVGELESLLIIQSKSGEDFIQMYAKVLQKDPSDPKFREVAASLWNIAASVSNYIMHDYQQKVRQILSDGNS